MKTLIVQYLPSGERSNTKKLLAAALEVFKTKQLEIETLDLAKDLPDFFTPERISVYYERNYGGQKVSAERMALMAGMDRMASQVKRADILVVASPMHNFSQPAVLKAWFDAVLQKGETWTFGPGGSYVGLMKGKKALFLSTSGGVYEGAAQAYEHCVSLTRTHLGFMGFDAEAVAVGGVNQFPDKAPAAIAAAQEKIRTLLGSWL